MTHEADDTLSDINITPFTDVLLVLLIVFMLAATSAVQTGFRVNLPQSVSREEAEQSRTVVTLGADGQVSVGAQKMPLASLRAHLGRIPEKTREKGLVVLADAKVPYSQLVAVMDLARASGFTAIGLGTQRKG